MKNLKKINIFALTVSYFSPLISVAQSATLDLNASGTTFYNVIDYLNDLLRFLNPILFSLSFVVFFWGLSKFILNSDSEDEIKKGKDYMIWGIVALFILISFRVIISFISSDLGIGGSTVTPQIPQA